MSTTSLPPELSGPPLVGHAIQLMTDPGAMIRRGLAEKGRIFSFRLGNKRAVMLLGPEHHRFFFEQTDKLLSIRDAYPFLVKMFDERLYFLAEPEEYKQQRSIILPCFKGAKMIDYVGVMARETRAFFDRLGPSGEFNLTSTLGPVVMRIAAAAFLGDDFGEHLREEFFGVFRHFSGGLDPIFPLWLPLPHLVRSKRARARLHAMIAERIAARRARPREPADFFQTLVEARYSDGRPFSDDVIINLVMMLVWAGHETTVGHVSWALVDLLRHPKYVASVLEQQEIILGGREELAREDLQRLDRVEWALKETERMNPVPMLLRMAREDIEHAGYRIPKGWLVFVAAMVSHRLGDVFASPDMYDPERFAPARAEDKTPYALIGFGGGPHRCTGVNFANQEMKVILTMLFQRYELTLVDQDPRPASGLQSHWPKSPCRIRYRLRATSTKRVQQGATDAHVTPSP